MTLQKLFPDVIFPQNNSLLTNNDYYFDYLQSQCVAIGKDVPARTPFFINFLYHFIRTHGRIILYYEDGKNEIESYADSIIADVLMKLGSVGIFLTEESYYLVPSIDKDIRARSLYTSSCDHGNENFLRIDIMSPSNHDEDSYGREHCVGNHFIFSVEGIKA